MWILGSRAARPIASDCFGSLAARRRHSISTAASGCISALQLSIFHFTNLNVCFSQQRPFRAKENHGNDGQLTATSRRYEERKGGQGCKCSALLGDFSTRRSAAVTYRHLSCFQVLLRSDRGNLQFASAHLAAPFGPPASALEYHWKGDSFSRRTRYTAAEKSQQ